MSLRSVPFDPHAFEQAIAGACGGVSDATQVRYLADYLGARGLRVRTMLVEQPYIDRHYIEEYGRYYASSFRPPSSFTTRIHVFADALDGDHLDEDVLDDERLDALLTEAATGAAARCRVESLLQARYRGFIVVRPLPSAPIGRTVLSSYSDKETRQYIALPHRVHIMGMELTVHGVPFQQQEVAVGACATTAMWSALSAASRAAGHRGPTPYQLTEAATRHILTDRHIPADGGLDLQQILSAVREAGFAPSVMKAHENRATFEHAVKCYLASGMPIVLILHGDDGHHAVTLVGYRVADDEHAAKPIEHERIRTTGFSKVYVHDDRLGPYARMLWQYDSDDDVPTLVHDPPIGARYSFDPAAMRVYAAVVPLYPKLRLGARGLLGVAASMFDVVRAWVAPEIRARLSVNLRFVLAGDYASELLEARLDDSVRAAKLVRSLVLPRYVGMIRFFVDDGAIFDVLCDTTDIFRAKPKYGNVIRIIPLVGGYDGFIAQFETLFCRHID